MHHMDAQVETKSHVDSKRSRSLANIGQNISIVEAAVKQLCLNCITGYNCCTVFL